MFRAENTRAKKEKKRTTTNSSKNRTSHAHLDASLRSLPFRAVGASTLASGRKHTQQGSSSLISPRRAVAEGHAVDVVVPLRKVHLEPLLQVVGQLVEILACNRRPRVSGTAQRVGGVAAASAPREERWSPHSVNSAFWCTRRCSAALAGITHHTRCVKLRAVVMADLPSIFQIPNP